MLPKGSKLFLKKTYEHEMCKVMGHSALRYYMTKFLKYVSKQTGVTEGHIRKIQSPSITKFGIPSCSQ